MVTDAKIQELRLAYSAETFGRMTFLIGATVCRIRRKHLNRGPLEIRRVAFFFRLPQTCWDAVALKLWTGVSVSRRRPTRPRFIQCCNPSGLFQGFGMIDMPKFLGAPEFFPLGKPFPLDREAVQEHGGCGGPSD